MDRPVIRIARDQLPPGCSISTSSSSPFSTTADNHLRDEVSSDDEPENLRRCLPELAADLSANPPAPSACDSAASSVAAQPAFVFTSTLTPDYATRDWVQAENTCFISSIVQLQCRCDQTEAKLARAEAGLVAAEASAVAQSGRLTHMEQQLAAAHVQIACLSQQLATSLAERSAALLVPPAAPQSEPLVQLVPQQQQPPQLRQQRSQRFPPAASPMQGPMQTSMQLLHQQPPCPQTQAPQPQQQQQQQLPRSARPQQSQPQQPRHIGRPNRPPRTFASVTADAPPPSRLPRPRAAASRSSPQPSPTRSLPFQRQLFSLRGLHGAHGTDYASFNAAPRSTLAAVNQWLASHLCGVPSASLPILVDAYPSGPPSASTVTIVASTMADAALLVHHRHRLKGLMEAGRPVILADVLSPEEELEHRRLLPAFRRARAAGQPAQFHRARLVVAGQRVA